MSAKAFTIHCKCLKCGHEIETTVTIWDTLSLLLLRLNAEHRANYPDCDAGERDVMLWVK